MYDIIISQSDTSSAHIMAKASTMLPLGTLAPDFNLPDVTTARSISLSDFSDKKALLVMFICRHCPYVQHVKRELASIGKDYKDKDLAVVAISTNDISVYPQDSPESLKGMAQEEGFSFPILFDETQEVAKSYTAACTPDLFLFDDDRKLVYRGQIDDSSPGNNIPLTGKDIRSAIDAVFSGESVDQNQKPSTGCGIKWKEGNEPAYFKNE